MSDVELLSFLKKSLGIIIKRLEEVGVRPSLPSEHAFLPEAEVTDKPIAIKARGAVWKIKNLGDHPVLFNLERPVGPGEYGLVPPRSYVVLTRAATTLYLKAPEGQRAVVKVDALGWE